MSGMNKLRVKEYVVNSGFGPRIGIVSEACEFRVGGCCQVNKRGKQSLEDPRLSLSCVIGRGKVIVGLHNTVKISSNDHGVGEEGRER